jgi:carboxyl-terminal processing protease
MSGLKKSVFRWSLLAVLLVGLVLGLSASSPWAKSPKPAGTEKQIALSVTTLLKSEHLSQRLLDREMSERFFNNFLNALDPQKLFFYQSDIDAFSRKKDRMAAMLDQGDIDFAYTVFDVFLTRIDERARLIEKLLAAPQNFSLDEEMVLKKELIIYARTPAEAHEKWRKRLKYEILLLKADRAAGKEDVGDQMPPEKRLLRRYQSLAKQMHQTDSEELVAIYLTALTTAFDPHTTYMSPRTMENFEIAMRLELEGIGAALSSVDGYTVVKEIIPGGAAERDGRLKAGDKIIGVAEGVRGEIIDVVDMKINDVVKMIRGKRDTTVRLQILSVKGDRKMINIKRAKIELKDREAQGEIFEFGRKEKGGSFKIGVIDLPSFYMDTVGAGKGISDYKSTTRDVRRIIEEFKRKGVEAVVLDLRRNGGGSLPEAINLTGLFIFDGPVLQVKDAQGRIYPHPDPDVRMLWTGPLVVVISKFSASASEILAGAIQDYERGLIVGDYATHGKGTVQNLIDLNRLGLRLFSKPSPMGSLKITTQQFFRPSGDSVQQRGVRSDIELPSLTTHLDVGESDLEYAVPFDRVPPMRFMTFGYNRQEVLGQLRHRSEARIKASEKFRKVLEHIDLYKAQKNRKSVNLNETTFLKERAAFNADREDENALENLDRSKSRGIKRDFYLEEVMGIAEDYLKILKIRREDREAA